MDLVPPARLWAAEVHSPILPSTVKCVDNRDQPHSGGSSVIEGPHVVKELEDLEGAGLRLPDDMELEPLERAYEDQALLACDPPIRE